MLLQGLNTHQVIPRGSTDKSVKESPGSDCYTKGKRSYIFPTVLLNSLEILQAYKHTNPWEECFPVKKHYSSSQTEMGDKYQTNLPVA